MSFSFSTEYLNQEVKAGALRWLQQIDFDPQSKSYGFADREYWAWKTKDFSNGTWQGGVLGFVFSNHLTDLSHAKKCEILTAVIIGTKRLQRSNGSFEEAFPFESSFAVTGLVLFDLLAAYYLEPECFNVTSVEQLNIIVKRALKFLTETPETHGVIANHLITSACAVRLAENFLTLSPSGVLKAALTLQTGEGSFPEYDGSDPGYQTLLNQYLLIYLLIINDAEAKLALEKSIKFCGTFCFHDGGFGGVFGSRGTRVLYPAGLCTLADGNLIHGPMTWLFEKAFRRIDNLTPSSVDQNNFVPLWNSWAALSYLISKDRLQDCAIAQYSVLQPSENQSLGVFSTPTLKIVYSLLNACVVTEHNGKRKNFAGLWKDNLTTQGKPLNIRETDTNFEIELQSYRRGQMFNTVSKMFVLRALAWVGSLIPPFARMYKRLLAKFVMGKSSGQGVAPTVRISKEDGSISVDQLQDWNLNSSHFHTHMASANTYENL